MNNQNDLQLSTILFWSMMNHNFIVAFYQYQPNNASLTWDWTSFLWNTSPKWTSLESVCVNLPSPLLCSALLRSMSSLAHTRTLPQHHLATINRLIVRDDGCCSLLELNRPVVFVGTPFVPSCYVSQLRSQVLIWQSNGHRLTGPDCGFANPFSLGPAA